MFKFPLQRVLELRSMREQAVATQLAEAKTVAEGARGAAEALEATREASRERMVEAGGPERTVGMMQHMSYVLSHLDVHIAEANEHASAAETHVSSVQQDLTVAFQERRILDRLRDRQLEAWRVGEAHLDRTTMDGIALSRYVQAGAHTSKQGNE